MTTITDAMLRHYNQLAARAEDEEAANYDAHRAEWERDEWKARAEAAEAEVERIKKLRQTEWGWAQTVVGQTRAEREAAEAEAAKWRELHADRDRDLAHEYARANAAEAEVERLRADEYSYAALEVARAEINWLRADLAELSAQYNGPRRPNGRLVTP